MIPDWRKVLLFGVLLGLLLGTLAFGCGAYVALR